MMIGEWRKSKGHRNGLSISEKHHDFFFIFFTKSTREKYIEMEIDMGMCAVCTAVKSNVRIDSYIMRIVVLH